MQSSDDAAHRECCRGWKQLSGLWLRHSQICKNFCSFLTLRKYKKEKTQTEKPTNQTEKTTTPPSRNSPSEGSKLAKYDPDCTFRHQRKASSAR